MPKPLVQTTGRRKQAVARVRLRPYDGGAASSSAPVAPAAPAAPAAASPASAEGAEGAAESPTVAPPAPASPDEGAAPAASARVSLVINGRPFESYFPSATQRMVVTEPLRLTDTLERYTVEATIDGGGVSGQAGALRLGIARALAEVDPSLRTQLKRTGLLTRDAREKESKKYGLKKARKAPQYSKR